MNSIYLSEKTKRRFFVNNRLKVLLGENFENYLDYPDSTKDLTLSDFTHLWEIVQKNDFKDLFAEDDRYELFYFSVKKTIAEFKDVVEKFSDNELKSKLRVQLEDMKLDYSNPRIKDEVVRIENILIYEKRSAISHGDFMKNILSDDFVDLFVTNCIEKYQRQKVNEFLEAI